MSSLPTKSLVQHHLSRVSPIQLRDFPLNSNNLVVRVCCVCCHPIYSGHLACERASRGHTGGRSHRISPPSFCGVALIFLARRIQPFLSLVDREAEFCALTIDRSPLVAHFYFFVRKNPSSCDCTRFELTSQRQNVLRLQSEPPGRPAVGINSTVVLVTSQITSSIYTIIGLQLLTKSGLSFVLASVAESVRT